MPFPTKLALLGERLWLRALPLLTRDYVRVSVDGFRLYGSLEHHIMLYWMLKGSYERFTRKLFQRALQPGMRVPDIGAHIGYYTLHGARGVGPSGKVYAFECDPGNARFLRHNVALNGFAGVVRVVPKAAASRAGVAQLFRDTANSGRSSLAIAGQGADSIEVECTTVDEVVQQEEIGVVKIDIEGAEIDALEDDKPWL